MRIRLVLLATVLILMAGFILQTRSPLRLNTDAVRLLHMADVRLQSGHFPQEQFPPAYPWLIDRLMRLGLTGKAWLVAVNYLSLAISLGLLVTLTPKRTLWDNRLLLILVVPLASWVIIKHALVPLTELPYTLVSILGLWSVSRAENSPSQRQRWLYLASAVLLALLATLTRTIGFALIAAVGITIVQALLKQTTPQVVSRLNQAAVNRFKIPVSIVGLVIGGALLCLVFADQYRNPGSYLNSGWRVLHEKGMTGLFTPLVYRCRELGQIGINLPASIIPPSIQWALVLIGAGLFFMTCRLLWQVRHKRKTAVYYIILYLGILMIWPYEDPRFWLPIIPVLVWLVVENISMASRLSRGLVTGWLTVYFCFGILALSHNVRLSFRTASFPANYTSGTMRASYEAAWGLPESEPLFAPDPTTVLILQRHSTRPTPLSK